MASSKQPFSENSSNEDASIEGRLKRIQFNDGIDKKFDFARYDEEVPRTAWLINMHPTELLDQNKRFISAVDYYFIQDDGSRFKASLPFKPYFCVAPAQGCEKEVASFLSRKYADTVASVDVLYKDDLDLPNHLMGLKRAYIKLSFFNVHDLMKVKKDLMPRIRRNNERQKSRTDYTDMLTRIAGGASDIEPPRQQTDHLDNIVDIREYDVPYHVRVSIDMKIFVGHWYTVTGHGSDNAPEILLNKELLDRPDPVILAFDIETTKAPLKFPDSQTDQIMMISYMIDGQGYLIVNRQIVSADINDFEYTPRPEYEGRFTVFNEIDEQAVIVRFFEHIQMVQPHIISTYNGDSFDWPFVEVRAAVYGLDMAKEIGFAKDSQGEYKSRPCIHMDAFKWVKRDSYLPIGSQNLKATTRAKLRYDPIELDPELMCRMAQEKPQVLASYSVSDAVATYYLYMKYVHPFIFALCMIIPMEPDEVLRKGSGTLCETLLMVEAFHCNIIFPNKQATELRQMTDDGHLIESETYVGGHVEALESGIFRADIPCRFRLSAAGLQKLIDEIEGTMKFAIEMEGIPVDKVKNFKEKCGEAAGTLATLRDNPSRLETPLIYHLDVGAMYPNIILTNRLQPPAIVNEAVCAACDFNRPGAKCQRAMEWMWRAEIVPASRSEYQRIVQQLENEKFPPAFPNGPPRPFHQLPKEEQVKIERKRLQEYCKKAYKRVHETRTELRVTTVCQRENSFYVDTVRAFRDRRYEYKALLKGAKKTLDAALKTGDASEIKSAKSKEVLYDSLQLAHKCILNSFYGYVMRKGSRWHSMEMAGIVCYTGANIITKSKELVDQIGRPLELDTDGIWCILPASFPENLTFAVDDPKRSSISISYPCAVLNMLVKDGFTNDQYHTMVKAGGGRATYEVHSENSIAFEVDGPYKAIVLPAAKEEGKRLKKRYAVFNFDGSIAELKGFEVKRRGELELIKIFQSSVFDAFLKGQTLEEVYQCVAKVADYWLDVLFTKGIDLPDSELFDLISENRSLSRKLEDYGEQKSTSITTAKRLAEFLGDEMVKDAGLNCQIVIAKKPEDAPVTERAIPMVIFQTEPTIRRHYLRKWLKCPDLQSHDIRDILDWNYYIERLGSAIQKIITIPAALQRVANPVPRVPYPDWLHKRLLEKTDVMKQKRITELFAPAEKTAATVVDVEEIGGGSPAASRKPASVTVHKRKRTLSGHFQNGEAIAPKQTAQTADAAADEELSRSWRAVLGQPPPMGTTKEEKQAWLSFMKRKWIFQKRQKVYFQRRTRNAPNTSAGGPIVSGVSAFVQRSARALAEQPWQIIQVLETGQPGMFRFWILVDGELRQIRVRVPRIFYINQRTPKDPPVGETYRQVHRILPRANQVHFLYEYRVEEKQYQEQVNLLQSELSAPHVEGIYESQVPLSFRVFAQLGCLCKVAEYQKQVGDFFSFSQLEFLSLAQATYLENDPMGHVYLYHYSQDSRCMLGLFFGSLRRAHVFIVDKSKTNTVNMSATYSTERQKRLDKTSEDELPPSELHFEVDVKASVKDVYRSVQRLLKTYKSEMRGPHMVIFESPLESQQLLSAMPALDEFPLVKLRVVAKEKLYSTLDWQRVGARHMMNGFLNSNAVLQASLELCRYLHIPLGNVPDDPALFGADLFFARYLWRQNYVLWCSPTERPDFGGKEVDDNRLITDFADFKDLNINRPRLYDSVCFELDIASVPVTALLQANRITEYEGVSGAVGFDTAPQLAIDEIVGGHSAYRILSTYDETALCAGTFRILKTMVHAWVKDITVYQNVFADNQIIHFYRWLCAANALLYDPALKRTVNGYMKKLMLLLIAELKRLGASVIYASLTRLVISTNKISSDDAMGYVKYILQQLQHKELFATLDVTINQSWKVLMWLDPANFGGGKLQLTQLAGGEQTIAEDEDEAPLVDMNWNMMYFLPEAGGCRAHFKTLVAGYIAVLYQEIRKQEKQDDSPASPMPRIAPDTSNVSFGSECANKSAFLKKEDDLVRFRQNLITGELNEKFYAIVDKIKRKISTGMREYSSGNLFPMLPGRHLKVTNPTLEFVKSICKVLSLDRTVDEEVTQLRRDLLKLVGVNEFSDEAQWVDPCLSYVLSEVICRNCNYCRDLDLCRDPYLIRQTTETGERPTWFCIHCKTPYDVMEIENTLIKHVNSLAMSYGLQDLKCGKCKKVKQAHMNVRCECGGQYTLTISTDNVALKLKTFSSIANYYNMKSLQETLQWIVILNPLMQKLLS